MLKQNLGVSVFIMALAVSVNSVGQNVRQEEIDKQNKIFQQSWGQDLIWKFADLPTRGAVEKFRMPYSGYIYPDTHGGTISAMQKYDRAFHRGRSRAAAWERWDTTAQREPVTMTYFRGGRGFFGGGGRSYTVTQLATPYWHGHCNGWAAAAIRHSEPLQSVRRNGVTFTPSDIKALLAEIYIYTEPHYLGGEFDYVVDPGTLHVMMANWIGRLSHPIAMESTPGKEKWNYPIYAYTTSHAKHGGGRVEVKMNIAYSNYIQQELDQSPHYKLVKYFHYSLELNDNGEIVGGWYYNDSSRIDLLWAALQPKPGGKAGNERGNPHVDIDTVLAIWRESVPEDTRDKWANIDPTEVDMTPAQRLAAAERARAELAVTTAASPDALSESGASEARVEAATSEADEE